MGIRSGKRRGTGMRLLVGLQNGYTGRETGGARGPEGYTPSIVKWDKIDKSI